MDYRYDDNGKIYRHTRHRIMADCVNICIRGRRPSSGPQFRIAFNRYINISADVFETLPRTVR